MERSKKERIVAELGQIFESSDAVVVAHYRGLTVAEMQDLRGRARIAGALVRVAKNRLSRLALQGKACAGIADLMDGMTMLIFSPDPVNAAKVAHNYARQNDKFQILGGAMGRMTLDRAGVEAAAKMPSKDEMIASIAGAIVAPGINLAAALGAPAAKIAGIISSIEEQRGEVQPS